MSDTSKLSTCQIVCWGLSGITGLMVSVVRVRIGRVLRGAACWGRRLAVFLALVFTQLICTGYGAGGRRASRRRDVKETMRHVTGITGYKAPFDEDDDDRSAARSGVNGAGIRPRAASCPCSRSPTRRF